MRFTRKAPEVPRRSRVVERKATQEFFSYHATRQSSERPPQASSRRQMPDVSSQLKRLRWGHLPTIIIVGALAVCLMYTTMLSSSARLQVGKGSRLLRSQQAYQTAVNQLLGGSVMNKSKLTINTDKVATELRQKFPELSGVHIALPLMGHRPVVTLVTSQPALFLETKSGVFLLDAHGKALVRITDVPAAADLNLPTLHDESGLTVVTGEGALSEQDVTFITTMKQQLEAKQLIISSLTLPPLAAELHVRLEGLPYYVKFSLLTDPRLTSGQFLALKERLQSDGVTPSEYIDSRVEERVYYK